MFAKLETKLAQVLQGSNLFSMFSARQKLFASLLDKNNLPVTYLISGKQ